MTTTSRPADPARAPSSAKPGRKDDPFGLLDLASRLGTEVDVVAMRLVRDEGEGYLGFVMLREQVGPRECYRGGVARHLDGEQATRSAVRRALLAGASALAGAAARWATRPGVVAVAVTSRDGQVQRLLTDGASRPQQDVLLEMLDVPGVLALETEVAAHRLVHTGPETIAIAAEPGHAVLDQLDEWLGSLLAAGQP